MNENVLKEIPFLAEIKLNKTGEKFIGIILNQTKKYTGMYVINKPDKAMTHEQLMKFIELGNIWWTESNRMLPITLFLKRDFDEYKSFMVNFDNHMIAEIKGHITSLSNITNKRIKRVTYKF